MKYIKYSSGKLCYNIQIDRKFTIIKGNSSTGKTTLCSVVSSELNNPTGALETNCNCMVLNNMTWRALLHDNYDTSVVFLADEDFSDASSAEFSRQALKSRHYFILITRADLENIPYSVNSIYELHYSGKYTTLKRLYDGRVFGNLSINSADKVLVEDSNSGYEFFKEAYTNLAEVSTSGGKSTVSKCLKEFNNKDTVVVIVDGSAFGSCINSISYLLYKNSNVKLCAPESFEYMLLCHPYFKLSSRYLDTAYLSEHIPIEYPSWERYFTDTIISITRGTPFEYSKSKINIVYLLDSFINTLFKVFPEFKLYKKHNEDDMLSLGKTNLFIK